MATIDAVRAALQGGGRGGERAGQRELQVTRKLPMSAFCNYMLYTSSLYKARAFIAKSAFAMSNASWYITGKQGSDKRTCSRFWCAAEAPEGAETQSWGCTGEYAKGSSSLLPGHHFCNAEPAQLNSLPLHWQGMRASTVKLRNRVHDMVYRLSSYNTIFCLVLALDRRKISCRPWTNSWMNFWMTPWRCQETDKPLRGQSWGSWSQKLLQTLAGGR